MDVLENVQFEGISICNAHCPFCPVGDPKRYFTRKQGQMSQEVFEKIIHDAIDLGVKHVIPFLSGEPLLAKTFFPWMDYIAEKGLTTTVFTNVSKLDKDKADRLAQYTNIDQVMLSFHGGTAEAYEKSMGFGPGSYDKNTAQAEYFISVSRSPVAVYMLNYEDTLGTEAQFREQWGSRAFVSDAFFNWAGDITVSDRSKSFEGARYPCPRALHHLTFLHTGVASLCCMDSQGKVALGDIMQEHMGEIWERNQWRRDMHHQLRFDELELCKDCNLNRFK